MQYLIPVISSFMLHAGGQDQWLWCPLNQKLWRWLMGIPIAIICGITLRSAIPIWCILTYFLATNVSSYGENHPFRKWFGRDGAWLIYGALFGLASLPVLGIYSIIQAIISSVSFWGLMKLSNDGISDYKLEHKWVEIIFGFVGTILYCL